MLIGKDLNDAINAQIGHELQAELHYLSVASYFESEALPKLAEFFFKQASDERMHAMKFLKYVLEAGGTVVIPAIPAPQASFKSGEEAVELSLKWEKSVTRNIFDLMEIAIKAKDYIAQQFLNWYTNEQLEEENTMDTLLRLMKRAGERNLIMMEAYFSHGFGNEEE